MSLAILKILLLAVWVSAQDQWSGLNCPAPRAPDNGLSFIFEEGREVRFTCHPGFTLVGSPVALCSKTDARWDYPVPECLPEKGATVENPESTLPQSDSNQNPVRPLFSWESPDETHEDSKDSPLVQGSRRLPLINGLHPRETTNVVGGIFTRQRPGRPAAVTPDLYNQELDIAEVRHRQQVEATRANSVLAFPRVDTRHKAASNGTWRRPDSAEAEQRRWRIAEARKTPNILYAGSRSASAYRAFPSVSTRTSASGHVTTIIQSHAPQNRTSSGESVRWDLSCLQSRSGRRLFIRAPKVPYAYVYRYERKRQPPHKPYLVAEYRCRRGFKMADSRNNALYCRRMDWVGEKPTCVPRA